MSKLRNMQVQKDGGIVTLCSLGPRVIVELPAFVKIRKKGEYHCEPLRVGARVSSQPVPLGPAVLLPVFCSWSPDTFLHSVFFHLALLLKTFFRSFCCARTSNPSCSLRCLPFPKGNAPGWRRVCLWPTACWMPLPPDHAIPYCGLISRLPPPKTVGFTDQQKNPWGFGPLPFSC